MKHPNYDLRIHKEADRAVFIDIISRAVHCFGAVSDYQYYGFGGPFLEDLQRIHVAFPTIKLWSIESDAETVKRQEFHRFANRSVLRIKQGNASEFFRDIDSQKGIFWLDYTNFGVAQITTFADLCAKSAVGSIIRITVRAACAFESRAKHESEAEKEWEDYIEKFRQQYSSILGSRHLAKEDFESGEGYCRLIADMIYATCVKRLKSTSHYLVPVCACYYRDETRMFTFTCAIESSEMPCTFVRDQKVSKRILKAFSNFPLNSFDLQVHNLYIPALSLRERLFLEKHMPVNAAKAERFKKCFGYLIDNSPDRHIEHITNFARLSQYYSPFARIVR